MTEAKAAAPAAPVLRARRRGGCGAFALLPALVLLAGPAAADPWIPAAGDGTIKPMIRLFDANEAFPAKAFTTNRNPSGTQTKTEYRLTGVQELGGNFSLEYDLRAALVRKSDLKHHHTVSTKAWGLEDQKIGLNYGLRQTPGFADSLELNVVLPTGSAGSSPALGTGRWAIEPDYQIGVASGRFSASLMVGPRQFLDGAVTQLRADGHIGFRATPRLTLAGTLFYVRSIQQRSYLPPSVRGELYNRFRLGAAAVFAVTKQIRPFVAYEVDVAGQGIHAGERITFGLAFHY